MEPRTLCQANTLAMSYPYHRFNFFYFDLGSPYVAKVGLKLIL